MARNKVTVDFSVIAEYAEKIDKLGGDLKATAEKALKESYDYVTPKLHADMSRHHLTGKTEESIADSENVEWEGSVASIKVGFKISDGGLPSIFLMYGTPRMKKDQKLYNDVYGSRTKKEIVEIQEKIFAEAIRKRMGG